MLFILSINIQVGLNMHLYDDIGDASSSLWGSTSSFFRTLNHLHPLISPPPHRPLYNISNLFTKIECVIVAPLPFFRSGYSFFSSFLTMCDSTSQYDQTPSVSLDSLLNHRFLLAAFSGINAHILPWMCFFHITEKKKHKATLKKKHLLSTYLRVCSHGLSRKCLKTM